ncbi:MAG: Lipase-like protein, partial [Myxococcaceae bacterium]|nr:Lipase-like protein [Myxococcaceae bacterium]
AAGPVARFELTADATPELLQVPFPSDVYRKDGKVIEIPGFERVFKKNGNYLTHELAKMDGFGRNTHAFFYVDDASAPKDEDGNIGFAPLDPASLPRDEDTCRSAASSVFVIDLAEPDPDKARVACRATFHDDTQFLSMTRPVLAVGPARGIMLEEGHAYAAVLTSRVKDKSGRALRASDDFRAIAAGSRKDAAATLYSDALRKAAAVLAGALGSDKAEIVAIAPYTTNAMTRELFQMRETIEDLPTPKLAWDEATVAPMAPARFGRAPLPPGFTATLDDWLGVVDPAAKLPDGTDDPDDDLPVHAHDQIAAVGTAVFEAANFLISKPGGYPTLDHGTFARDASNAIVVAPDRPTQKIWVTFAVPTAAMPAGGYPTVIIQHGLSGSRQYLLDLANTMAKKGWIAVAIDSVTFGARAPDPRYQIDAATDWQSAPGAKYRGPDGISDIVGADRNGPSDFFGGLLNIGALRDQLREAAIDTTQLVKMLRGDPDLSPLATNGVTPKIDPARIAYLGDSLGAIEGTVAAAIEPNVKLWTLNVDGGSIILEAGNHGPGIGSLLGAAASIGFGINFDHLSESHPMINIVQTIIEPADPIGFAKYLVKSPGSVKGVPIAPRNILQIEVLYDELIGNEGSEALARAAGLGLAEPNAGSNAGTIDLKNLSANTGRVPLASIPPDASGAIHDTPLAGVTAVVVQASPAEHGSDLVRGLGKRQSKIPYAKWDTREPFTKLDPEDVFKVKDPYRELQATVVRFFEDGFADRVPSVIGFKAPVRDFDDDGATDDVDPDPSDPRVK